MYIIRLWINLFSLLCLPSFLFSFHPFLLYFWTSVTKWELQSCGTSVSHWGRDTLPEGSSKVVNFNSISFRISVLILIQTVCCLYLRNHSNLIIIPMSLYLGSSMLLFVFCTIDCMVVVWLYWALFFLFGNTQGLHQINFHWFINPITVIHAPLPRNPNHFASYRRSRTPWTTTRMATKLRTQQCLELNLSYRGRSMPVKWAHNRPVLPISQNKWAKCIWGTIKVTFALLTIVNIYYSLMHINH